MGWSHHFNHEANEGFSLDLASKVALEVERPSHFLLGVVSGEYVLNGAADFKSRLVRSYGWRVAHVAVFEVDDKSEPERRALLVAKLAEVGVLLEINL
mmetsp:Transcript_28945/g.88492  ORF Transcript_28945/g.88492 Transcript_28945/m.88492 type:complete len:98 (+) Transcript_28945:759-1052(+)